MFTKNQQTGFILPLALLLLLAITLVGVTSFRLNINDEKMARNVYLRAQAEQAAQITLRFAEDQILAAAITPNSFDRLVFFNNGQNDNSLTENNDGDFCTAGDANGPGLCIPMRRTERYDPLAPEYEVWVDKNDPGKASLNVWANPARNRTLPIGPGSITAQLNLDAPPQYIIEFLGYTPDITTATTLAPDVIAPPGVSVGNRTLKTSSCDEDRSGDDSGDTIAGWNVWPFCRTDHKSYRITALATAGNTRVMLQSVYTTP